MLDIILNFLVNGITAKNATMATGVTGFVKYVKVGNLVVLTGVVSTTTNKAAGSDLCTGLPQPTGGYTIGDMRTFDGDYFGIGSGGNLFPRAQVASGRNNIRFAYSYIS